MPAGRLQLLCQPPRDVGVHGRGGDEHRILGQRLGDAVLAEQNGFGLRGVDDHADDDVGRPGGLRRRPGALAAVGDEPRHRVGRDVAAGDVKTRALERGRHAKAHRAQPDDGDARFWDGGFRHAAIPSGFLTAEFGSGFASGYHGLAALPKHETRRQKDGQDAAMTETRIREEICRLGRSLFERGLTPGSSGNISVQALTTAAGW